MVRNFLDLLEDAVTWLSDIHEIVKKISKLQSGLISLKAHKLALFCLFMSQFI